MQTHDTVSISRTEVRLYDLSLDLDFQNSKFSGRLLIDLDSEKDLKLDSVGLTVEAVRANGRTVNFTTDKESLTIPTGPFSGKLEIEYSGSVPLAPSRNLQSAIRR